MERNLNIQKVLSYILYWRFNKIFLRTPARSNKILSLKPLPPARTLDIVRYVTSSVIFSLLGYRVRPTVTYYIETFDVKLP